MIEALIVITIAVAIIVVMFGIAIIQGINDLFRKISDIDRQLFSARNKRGRGVATYEYKETTKKGETK